MQAVARWVGISRNGKMGFEVVFETAKW